jgi:hypothetical protein
MTRIYLTDEDYAVINRGDPDEMKRHFNGVRGELVDLQATVRDAVKNTPDPAERVCKLRQETNRRYSEYEPTD